MMNPNSPNSWIADRTLAFDSSGIRKVFALAATMKNPINLSIGQPDYDVPAPIKEAACQAIQAGKNMYSPTQGIAPLIDKLQQDITHKYKHDDRSVFVSSGTSGGLVLAMLSLVNPGDEVIVFDPYFVMYVPLIQLVGGVPVLIDTYPDFRIDIDKVASAITSKTKLVLFNSPSNPTGVTASPEEVRGIAELCYKKGIALISDEIYSAFHFGNPTPSPAEFNPHTIVIDGFSKTYAMTGWRLGYVHDQVAAVHVCLRPDSTATGIPGSLGLRHDRLLCELS
jgi:aspartate aminotransferase/aminotransferase